MSCLAAPTLCLWMKPQDKEDAVGEQIHGPRGEIFRRIVHRDGVYTPR